MVPLAALLFAIGAAWLGWLSWLSVASCVLCVLGLDVVARILLQDARSPRLSLRQPQPQPHAPFGREGARCKLALVVSVGVGEVGSGGYTSSASALLHLLGGLSAALRRATKHSLDVMRWGYRLAFVQSALNTHFKHLEVQRKLSVDEPQVRLALVPVQSFRSLHASRSCHARCAPSLQVVYVRLQPKLRTLVDVAETNPSKLEAAKRETKAWLDDKMTGGALLVQVLDAVRTRRSEGAFVLALDGGGMAGVVTLIICSELERHLEAPLSQVFE